MARRNPPPGPTKAKAANKPRIQRKPKNEGVTVVNDRKTETDVAKLINCLDEWTRELRAARSTTPEVPPGRSRSSSHGRKVVSAVSRTPHYRAGPPHRIDGIQGPEVGGVVGVHRGRCTNAK